MSPIDLRPKHSLHSFKTKQSAVRQFTDREKPTAAFKKALKEKVTDQYKVLTYYGIGGIGKTRLQAELLNKVEEIDPKAINVVLDFKEEKLRNASDALISLREQLSKEQKVKFTTFDLAYAIYWTKSNPQLDMKDPAYHIPFIEEGSFISELIDHLEYVPFAQWVPKSLKFITGMMKYKDMLSWWNGRGKDVLAQLQEMKPFEIEERLPVYWAADLKDYLKNNDLSAIIFIDTFEALWQNARLVGSFHKKDEWVREFVLHLLEVLWVICGREKIRWDEINPSWNDVLDQHLMGELSSNDSNKFLLSCGVNEDDIRDAMISSSQGLPYYLDLMVDTYHLIQEQRIPKTKDFANTPHEISERFMRYLDLSERESLKILSCTRFWDTHLFRELITHFKTGYPATAYDELFRFSFIINHEGEWQMHAIMRASLQEEMKKQSMSLFNDVHHYLFSYFDNVITADNPVAFREAFFHGSILGKSQELLEWFLKRGELFKKAGSYQLLLSFEDEVTEMYTDNEDVYAFFATIHMYVGNYEKAITYYEKTIDITNEEKLTNNITVAKCYTDLAEIMIQIAEYEKAYAYLFKADKLYDFVVERGDDVATNQALLQIRLGKLNIRFAKYDEAMENYTKAISCCDQVSTVESKGIEALAYEKLGELLGSTNLEKQGECYHQSVALYKEALQGKTATNNMRLLTNQGLAYKRLAEYYCSKNELPEAMKSFREALSIYERVLEKAPNFVDTLEKKGHASVDYLALLIKVGFYEDALQVFEDAKDAFQKALELSPQQGSSRNRLASAYREIAGLYLTKGEATQAIATLHEALKLSEETRKYSPDYIYVNNSIGKIHKRLAEAYITLNENKMVQFHYTEALEYFNKMLEKAPGLRGTLQNIAEIEEKMQQL
ncbi:hypothetical protein CIB95_11665 [Lottiidibacillus patelloidae]|uniref:Orc1-like AAA ATPase domain-containing protein n=1 Tax=Lottiidibacillus patelloidae TaxID=2670334 RepID=A0A263BRU8_9BACI|nr:tetratricopeptide repeat protein [Lottiidibacillus patelloidae]OZM56425.1 hypothetical protein CIB95_11665 [Lottiidibacillus patelloidae]